MTPDDILKGLYEETMVGNAPAVLELTNQGLQMGMTPDDILFEALIPSLEEVGARFERGDYFVPEMLIAGKAMSGALDILRPLLAQTGAETVGTFVMGTVKGDVHSIGKNILKLLFETSGYEVHDLGIDVDLFKFVDKANEVNADVIAMSALLTTTLIGQRDVIDALKDQGTRDKFKVMVGGGATTQEWADTIGADGWAATAYEAVTISTKLVS